jgi:hypothetical protein
MTFKEALRIISTNLIQKMVVPDWVKYLTKQAGKTELAFKELKVRYFETY